MQNPFRYFNSSPEVIRLAVMMCVRYPLSLRQVEDLLFKRGIDICHETVRFWWNRFGPLLAAEIRKRRVHHRSFSNWRWHLDEVFVRINGETRYLWRAADHEGEVLKVFATKRRDRKDSLKFLKRTMKRYGQANAIVTDRLRSYAAAMKVIGIVGRQESGCWLNNRPKTRISRFFKAFRADLNAEFGRGGYRALVDG
jgi:putative transposase